MENWCSDKKRVARITMIGTKQVTHTLFHLVRRLMEVGIVDAIQPPS